VRWGVEGMIVELVGIMYQVTGGKKCGQENGKGKKNVGPEKDRGRLNHHEKDCGRLNHHEKDRGLLNDPKKDRGHLNHPEKDLGF